MNYSSICWQDNKIIPTQSAQINVMDHGFLYGDGVFEGIRFYHKQAFMLADHLQRLQESAEAIGLKIPYTMKQLEGFINELIAKFEGDNGYIRLIISRGVGNLGINPKHCASPKVTIIADQIQIVNKAHKKGVKVCVAKVKRIPSECLNPKVKSLNYLNNIMARIEANQRGFDEAIMLNLAGNVAEGSVDNVFMVKDNQLITPPASAGMLMGITRQVVIQVAIENGIGVTENNIKVADLLQADECFLTGTGAELLPVKLIEDKYFDIENFNLFNKIQNLFMSAINKHCLINN